MLKSTNAHVHHVIPLTDSLDCRLDSIEIADESVCPNAAFLILFLKFFLLQR